MKTICFQCALEALDRGETPALFDEEPMEHARRVHPPGSIDPKQRAALEARVGDKVRSWAEGIR